jgi:hypothetical protein
MPVVVVRQLDPRDAASLGDVCDGSQSPKICGSIGSCGRARSRLRC